MIGLCVIMFIAQKASRDAVTLDLLLIPGVTWYQPWRMVTAAFLHAGIFHLLLNMYALWVVGSFMEQVLGRARMVALYLGSALGGHMLVLIYYRLSDSSWGGFTLGASGAVFGLFAAILVGGRRQRANIRGIVAVIGLNLVLSFTVPGISWQGHVGGLLVGAAMAWAYFYAPPAKRRLWAWLAPIGVVALTVLVMILTVSPLTW
jgi:membrane associated rhomboid family serine protease